MKKLAIFAGAVAMLAFVSCKKEYTCECTATTTEEDGTVTTEKIGSGTIEDKKSAAEDECNEGDTSIEMFGTKVETDCEIK